MNIKISRVLALMGKWKLSLLEAFSSIEKGVTEKVTDNRIYCITYREVLKNSWGVIFKTVKRSNAQLVLVEDPETGYRATPGDVRWYNDKQLAEHGEEYTRIGNRESIMSEITGLTDKDFDNAKTIDHLRMEDVSVYVGRFIDGIPHVENLFTLHLKSLIQKGIKVYKDVVVVDHVVDGVMVNRETTPEEFLDYYHRKLRVQHVGGVIAELPTKDEIARGILREGMLQHFHVIELMTNEDISAMSAAVRMREYVVPTISESHSKVIKDAIGSQWDQMGATSN